MELNSGQQRALTKFKRWWKYRDKQVFELSGGPGTGKTHIVRIMIESVGLDLDEVLFCAYTGKAAIALRKNGLNGKTIHSTLYEPEIVPKEDEDGEPILDENDKPVYTVKFIPKEKIDEGIRLIVVDEASMVPPEYGKQIKRFKVPVLAVGDLNQLGPIFGSPYFLAHPDAVLTEIMRQEKGSPIIQISQDILNGKYLRYGDYDNEGVVKLIPIDEVCQTQDLKSFDAILCGRNATRVSFNKYIRKFLYDIDSPYPVIGDRLICRKNNWTAEVNGIPLVNGLTGVVDGIDESSYRKNTMVLDFLADDLPASFNNLKIDLRMLNKLKLDKDLDSRSRYDIFDYGYAITGHLAQGSQYSSVLVVADCMGFSDAQSWLYTAVTRAIDRVVIAF